MIAYQQVTKLEANKKNSNCIRSSQIKISAIVINAVSHPTKNKKHSTIINKMFVSSILDKEGLHESDTSRSRQSRYYIFPLIYLVQKASYLIQISLGKHATVVPYRSHQADTICIVQVLTQIREPCGLKQLDHEIGIHLANVCARAVPYIYHPPNII